MEQAFPEILAQRGKPTVVLASGDPFCFGVGSKMAELVSMAEMVCVPAASAFSLACARLGWAQQSVSTLSFCGRPLEAVRPLLQPGQRLLALSEGPETPRILAAYLCSLGFGPSLMHIMQSLGGPKERTVTVTAQSYGQNMVDPLNLVALELVAGLDAPVIPLTPGLDDGFFEHDGQMTKHEMRAVTLAALAPRAGEHLWDIGCGAGSVAIEWLLRHPANTAEGVERLPHRADRALRNASRLGVPGLQVLVAEAPSGLEQLARPDAVFIGGGASEALVDGAWSALRPGGRLVINAVTLETTRLLFDLPERFGGRLTRLSIEHLDHVGPRQAFRPAMAVTQFVAVKP
jgi:precorrin-6Y C5,15-methyltransferase (decarboxylating)